MSKFTQTAMYHLSALEWFDLSKLDCRSRQSLEHAFKTIRKVLEDQASRQWQGLTDEDIEEIWGEPVGFMYGRYYDAIRAIEERLREKNT